MYREREHVSRERASSMCALGVAVGIDARARACSDRREAREKEKHVPRDTEREASSESREPIPSMPTEESLNHKA